MRPELTGKLPEVSVVMSVYAPPEKAVFFDAVNSIILQSFTDWEMIIYDDGCTPDGSELIKEAARLDERIVYIKGKENKGLGFGLNRCIAQSRGRYIARMDADDVSLPGRIMKQRDFLENNPGFAWVGSNAQLIDSSGRWGVWKMPREPEPEDFLKYSPFIHPCVMFRKEVFENGGYTQDNKRAEDYELFMKLYCAGLKGYNLQEVLFCYREDYAAYRRRKYSFHIHEVKIRLTGFKSLGLLNIKGLAFALKPLFVGLIPAKLLSGIKRRIRKRTYVERHRKREA